MSGTIIEPIKLKYKRYYITDILRSILYGVTLRSLREVQSKFWMNWLFLFWNVYNEKSLVFNSWIADSPRDKEAMKKKPELSSFVSVTFRHDVIFYRIFNKKLKKNIFQMSIGDQ